MRWIDIGLNLTNSRYLDDYAQVVNHAISVGVTQMIVTGTSVAESQRALALCREFKGIIYATAGCHPHDAKTLDSDGLLCIENLALLPQVVAIGECGLDFNRNFSPREDQIKAFTLQLELAVKLGKPVFLHERDAFDTQYQILCDFMPKLKGAVAHCFTGNRAQAEKYVDLGLSIGVTGWLCDERRGKDLLEAVKHIPQQRLMLETDGPFLTPRDLTPKPENNRNEPRFLPHIGHALAKARNESVEALAAACLLNTQQFFNLPS